MYQTMAFHNVEPYYHGLYFMQFIVSGIYLYSFC